MTVARAAVALAAALAAMTPSCASLRHTSPPSDTPLTRTLAADADLRVIVHPRYLRRDPVYGALARHIIDAVRARNSLFDSVRLIDAFESADAVQLSVSDASDASDVIVVLFGVRADIDPARITTGEGTKWSRGPRGDVTTYEPVRGSPYRLYVLPGRTWVVGNAATLDARIEPLRGVELVVPADEGCDGSLACILLGGPQALGMLQRRAPRLTNALDRVIVALRERNEGLRIRLEYRTASNASAAARLLEHTADLLADKARRGGEDLDVLANLAWLGTAKIDRIDAHVQLDVRLPPKMLETIKSARAEDFDLAP